MEQSKTQFLADLLSAIGGFVGDGRKVVRMTDIAAELRRLSAIEAERDALRAEVERLRAAPAPVAQGAAFPALSASTHTARLLADEPRQRMTPEMLLAWANDAAAELRRLDGIEDIAAYYWQRINELKFGQTSEDAPAPVAQPVDPMALLTEADILASAEGWRQFDAPEGANFATSMIYGVCRAAMNAYRDALVRAAPAPVALTLTDEQINDEAWRVEAVEEYEQYTGSPRLKVEGLHDFAHAIAAKLHASTAPAPVALSPAQPLRKAVINATISRHEVYQYHPGALLEFVRAIERACAEAWGVTLATGQEGGK
jgi:hypothetical protein